MADKLDVNDIMKMMPHRYPFLLVDRVNDCVPGKSIEALKNVTINEPYFAGHFPVRPVMPGVLIVEALAQACGVLTMRTLDDPELVHKTLFYLAGIEKARFRRPVEPGDQLVLKCKLSRQRRGIWRFSCRAEVDGELACEAEMTSVGKEMPQ